MSDQQQPQDQHMVKTLANDLRILKSELDAERKKREEIETSARAREEYLKELEANVNAVKVEKREQYGKILDEDVMPYLKSFKEDPQLVTAVEHMEGTLKSGLDNAFMNPAEHNTLRLMTAVASADKIRSSDLQRLLETERGWHERMEEMTQKSKEIEEAALKKTKEIEEASAAKDELVRQLQEELTRLRNEAEKSKENISNTEAHFDAKAPPIAPLHVPVSAPVVQATASGARASSSRGIDSIFDFRPRTSWRTNFPDPGYASKKQ